MNLSRIITGYFEKATNKPTIEMIFSPETKPVIESSRHVAIELNSGYISSYHFLLAILENDNIPRKIFDNRKWGFKHLKKTLLEDKREPS